MKVHKHSRFLAQLLARELHQQSRLVGVEVGVHRGFTSHHLLQSLPGLFLYLVDRWDPAPFKAPENQFSMMAKQQDRPAVFEGWYREAVRNTSAFANSRRILRMDFRRAVGEIDQPLDFCFLDAAHSYVDTRDQIACYEPLVRPGGIVAGHDYGFPRAGYEVVKQAVDEAAEQLGVQLHVDKPSYVWWWTKK